MRLALLLALTAFLAAACDAPKTPRPLAALTASTDNETESGGAAWTPLGLQVREVPQAAMKALGVAYGVMVTKVRAPANRSRILPGDVIVGVNQTRIRNVAEFNSLIADQSRGTIGLLVRRVDTDLYIPLYPAESVKAPRPARDKPLRT